MALPYRGGGIGQKVDPGGRNLRRRMRTRPPLAHAYPSSARRRQARPDLQRGRASPAKGSRGPNRAATARPVTRTSGLALRVFRSPFAGSSPLWLRDGVGGPTIGCTARRGAPAPLMRSILRSEPPHQTQSEEGRSPRRPRSCHEPKVLWRGSPSNSGGSGQVKGRSLKGLRVGVVTAARWVSDPAKLDLRSTHDPGL